MITNIDTVQPAKQVVWVIYNSYFVKGAKKTPRLGEIC